MNIEEIREDEAAKIDGNTEDRTEWVKEDIYDFKYLDASFYKNISTKDTQALLAKWGLSPNDMEIAKFRFNQGFNLFNTERFLKDLFNSSELRAAMPQLSAKLTSQASNVESDKLSTDVINMGFFDIL